MSLKIFIILAVLVAIACLILLFWSFKIEPNLLEIKDYKLNNDKLAGLKIVYATDFHIAKSDTKRLNRIIEAINSQKADLILLGGDFIKGHNDLKTMSPERIAAKLRKLQAPLGVFSVLGNHDWYIGGRKMKHALQAAGIVVLENDNEVLTYNEQKFTIAGVADKITCVADSIDALEIGVAVRKHFGITFSDIEENNKKMIVSKGLGTSRIPVRFNCKPEIVVIEFTE